MHIRSAIPADAHRIATIHVAAWQAAYRHIMRDSVLHRQSVECRKAFWTKELVAGVSRTFVAEDEGGFVGWVNFGACRDADAPANAEVYVSTWIQGDYGVALARLSGTSCWRK